MNGTGILQSLWGSLDQCSGANPPHTHWGHSALHQTLDAVWRVLHIPNWPARQFVSSRRADCWDLGACLVSWYKSRCLAHMAFI